jgi:hypothetical protein
VRSVAAIDNSAIFSSAVKMQFYFFKSVEFGLELGRSYTEYNTSTGFLGLSATVFW